MAASIFTMLLILCVRTNSSKGNSTAQINTFQVSDVLYFIHLLSWKKILIVHDSDSDKQASQLISKLERSEDILFTVASLSRNEENDFLLLIYRKHLYNSMNIVRLISTKCSSAESRSDLVPSGTTEILFNTKSRWLIFPSSWCSSFTTSKYQTNLTNVAVVMPTLNHCRGILTLNDNIFQTVSGTSTDENIFPNIRYKLNGKKIKIGVVPGNLFERNLDKVLDVMSRYLNFTYDIVNSSNGEYGIQSNGTWSGLMGQLVNQEVDLGLTTLTNTVERREAVDFLRPLGTDKMGLLYKKELLAGDSWFLLTRPLQLEVYLCTMLSFICVSLFFMYLSNREANAQNCNRRADNVEFVLAALFLEGGNFHLKGTPARILFAFWLMFCVVLAATYTATLLRSLVPKEVKPFETLQDLLDLPDWRIGIMRSSSDFDYLNKSKDENVQMFLKSLIRHTQTDANIQSADIKVHMKRVIQGKYAFVFSGGLKLIKIYGHCSLELNDRLFDNSTTGYSVAVPKGSLFKTDLDDFMDKIWNTGLLEEIMKPQDNRSCVINDTVKPLFLGNVKGVFALLAGGVVLAGITLVIENVLHC